MGVSPSEVYVEVIQQHRIGYVRRSMKGLYSDLLDVFRVHRVWRSNAAIELRLGDETVLSCERGVKEMYSRRYRGRIWKGRGGFLTLLNTT